MLQMRARKAVGSVSVTNHPSWSQYSPQMSSALLRDDRYCYFSSKTGQSGHPTKRTLRPILARRYHPDSLDRHRESVCESPLGREIRVDSGTDSRQIMSWQAIEKPS